MGDEHDRLAGHVPQAQELLVQHVAHDLVEGAERLVHEQEIGVERERPRDRRPLLHAAGQLPGKFGAKAGKIDQLQSFRDARLALRLGEAHDLERQRDVAGDAAPRIERRGLEHIAIGAVEARFVRTHAIDADCAAGRSLEIRDGAQERGLAAARRSDEGDELASRDLQADVAERLDRAIGGVEAQ